MSKTAIKAGTYFLFALLPALMWRKYTGAFSETKTFNDRKRLYRQRRDSFRDNEAALAELQQWKAKNSDCDYQRLAGMIPPRMVGKTIGTDVAFAKSDTWFSEFALHNDNNLILSESAESYIIGNLESYDKRQYPQWFNPNNRPGENTPEGQAFGHSLVIPKRRIFNIVDPEATANDASAIKELRDHFISFWNNGGSYKVLERTRSGFEDQNTKLATEPSTLTRYQHLLPTLKADFEALSRTFRKLKAEDFEYAFHAFPDISVGHLHMHVFPKNSELRRFSTRTHDWKTIPIEAVLEAEEEDSRAKEPIS